jgi:hypothetical protein
MILSDWVLLQFPLKPGMFRSIISLKYRLSVFAFPLAMVFEMEGEGSSWPNAVPNDTRKIKQNNFKVPGIRIFFSKLGFLGISDICPE